jgi:hypothetical protein
MRSNTSLALLGLPALLGLLAHPAPARGDAAAPPAPAAPSTAAPAPRDVSYDLEIEDDSLVVKGVNLGGQVMDAIVDTGAPEIALPASQAKAIQFRSVSQQPALDFAGASQDYPEGFFPGRRLGGDREQYLSASVLPDEQLDGKAILPLSALEGPLICFLCSQGKLEICDSSPQWDENANSGTGPAQKSYLPYWENIAGLFLGIDAGGKYYFAQIDTGSSTCTATQAFIDAHPELFKAEPKAAHFTGIHGGAPAEEQIYRLDGPIKLLSIDGKGDVALPGEVSAVPSVTADGDPAPPGDLGSDSSPYLGLDGPAPWPVVMTIGMDLLAQYDFAFDTNQHLLILSKPGDAAAAAATATAQ